MRQPFVGLVLAAIIGIVVADYFPAITVPIFLIAIAGALAAWRWTFAPLVFAVVGATFFVLHSTRITNTAADALAQIAGQQPRPANVTGIVTTEPKIEANGNSTFLLKLRGAKIENQDIRTDAAVFVRWRGRPNIGDELALFGTFQPIEPPRNPGEFDTRAYLARRDVKSVFIVRYPENGRILSPGSGFSVLRAAAQSREWMQRILSRDIENSPDVVGLICGTALGLRHQTRDDIEEPFQQTGTLHLFAVAGLHVGIVARLLWTVAMVVRLPRKAATALIIPLLFFYAAVTGLHTASVRAAVMSALLLGGIFFDRKVLALNSLAAAAFLILLFDSNQLFTSGFQLSFAVVGTIVLLADPAFVPFERVVAPDPFLPPALLSRAQRFCLKGGRKLARGASVSLAAWIGSLLLIYWYFYLITPVSLAANLVVVPIAYVVLALAMLSLIAASISSGLSIIFNNANWLMSHAILSLVHFFALLPGGHLYLPRFTELQTPIMITVLDEGTGGAAYIRANGYDWLIDCGGERSYERTLKSFLHSRGVNRLQGILLTHGDAHHIGAALETIADYAPREIYDNPVDVRSSALRRFRDAPRKPESRLLFRGDSLLLGRNVHAEILYPPPNIKIRSADDAPLIVQLVVNEQIRVLFESDAGTEAEKALLGSGDDLKSDILIKGQHHSGDSGTPEFLDGVKPKLIIATSRESPVAEQISEEWSGEIARRGIKLFRQDWTGAVEIQFRGEDWTARSYLTGEDFRSSKR
ncbi:MAG TPA: ComEC/Rec2 family competence protein [Chthoniobacterales bacterium]|nr:ComEC/Rec2 family competence protein [Chthoniobacterales bacterium]